MVELAEEEGGFMPELSYGTHFFQDLVETGIFYVALFPCKSTTIYNLHRLDEQFNRLADYLPDPGKWSEVIQVYEMGHTADELWIEADVRNRQTVCFFK